MRGKATAAAIAAVSAITAGSALYALAAGAAKVVTACQSRTGVRVITVGSAPAKCRTSESRVVWNLAGPRGPAGVPGRPGPGLLPAQLTLGAGVPVVLSGSGYKFNEPVAVAFDGSAVKPTIGTVDRSLYLSDHMAVDFWF